MPRSVRIEYAGALYHVMCRGDRREPIFRTDDDRQLMLETLAEMCARTGQRVHSYVLMPNHYHLLLETPDANLVAGMKWFQGTYTQRFNARHRVCGHLFQGRYKAVPIDAEDGAYIRLVSDYILLNPARAGLLPAPRRGLAGFRWSSYPAFVAGRALPEWLERQRVFASHGLPDEHAGSRRRYAAWMRHRVRALGGAVGDPELEAEWRSLRRGWYLGNETFRDRLQDAVAAWVGARKRASYGGAGLGRHDEQAAGQRLRWALGCLGLSQEEVRGRKQNDPVKQAVAWSVKGRSVVSDEWICHQLEMGSRVNVSRAVSAFRNPRDAVRTQLKTKLYVCTD